MAVSLKHKFASSKADGGDTSLVRPSNWNDEHDLLIDASKIVGRTTAGTGIAEEIGVSSELTLTGGTLGLASSLGGKDFTGPTTVAVNSTSPALRITQTGTGNAFVVEDSASTDSTPFVIDAGGNVLSGKTTSQSVGTATPQFQIHSTIGSSVWNSYANFNWAAAAQGAGSVFGKSRGGTVGVNGVVINGDEIGRQSFYGDDGINFIETAKIEAKIDGTPGTNDMPGRIVLSTTGDGASSPTERMRIGSTGAVAIGSTVTSGGNAGCSLRFANNLTGGVSTVSVLGTPQVQSDVTNIATIFSSTPTTQATSFTLSTLQHFVASQGAIGSGSSISNQYGFSVAGTLTGATNNYGFFGNIAAGTGRWNFYAAGTANNYFAGNVLAGNTTSLNSGSPGNPESKIQVAGNSYATSSASLFHYQLAAANASFVGFNKSRGGAIGTQTALINGDRMGGIEFSGSDGAAFIPAARIDSSVDGTPGTNDMPGRIVLSTTSDGAASPSERVRITSSGNVGIGTSAPTQKLDINDDSVRVRTAKTPASATASGTQGQIAWDADYIYVCTATNTWKRTALLTWV
jgi:hypothetical protein